MNSTPDSATAQPPVPPTAPVSARSTWKRKALIITAVILGTATVAAAGSAWWVKHNIYASALQPVALTQSEQTDLQGKLKVLANAPPAVDPELAKRTMQITEKEINAFLSDQGLGGQVKVDLSDGGAAATVLIPIDKDAPLLGGVTLRLRLAFGARMNADKQFSLSLNDVSVGGVPLPNAWLGQLKGLNLLADSHLENDPAVKGFLAGIRDFKIEPGAMKIVLNE